MDVKIMKLKQYNSTWKHLLVINGEPLCIFDSQNRANEALQYLNGYDADINDGHVKKVLNKYRLPLKNVATRKAIHRKNKAIRKFSDLETSECG